MACQLHDVAMPQLFERFNFQCEPLPHVVVAARQSREHFDGNRLTGLPVSGGVDRAHAAFSKRSFDLVWTELNRWHELQFADEKREVTGYRLQEMGSS